LGSLTPGETLTVPVTVEFGTPGARNLTVVATVSDADGEETTVRRPLSVVVESGAPQIELAADGLVAGADTPASVTVSNPTTAALRGLTVSVVGVDGERTRRTIPTLAAGASQTLNLSLRPVAAGGRAVTVEVAYTTAAGTRATATREYAVDVAEPVDDVGIRVERTTASDEGSGAGSAVSGIAGALGGGDTLQSGDGGEETEAVRTASVTVTNFGNAPIEEVVLVPRLPNGSAAPELGRVAVSDSIAPGEEASVSVDLTAARAATLRFAVEYDLGRQTGAVSVTGLNLTLEDDRLRLSGNLGNVGDGEVRGVVVSVGQGEYVAPAYPQRDQFLGTVGPSEFAPFELTAQIDAANATSVPVRVTYTTAGERRTMTADVALPDGDGVQQEGILGGIGDTAVGVGLGLVVTLPLVVFGARRYR